MNKYENQKYDNSKIYLRNKLHRNNSFAAFYFK